MTVTVGGALVSLCHALLPDRRIKPLQGKYHPQKKRNKPLSVVYMSCDQI